jgi:hypothetical protein
MFEAESSRKTTLDRGFFSTIGRLEASVAAADAMLSRARSTSFGQKLDYTNDSLTKRETAILRFLTAIELIESDLWQQYDELGGATAAEQNDYQLALQFLNRLGSECITANAVNEIEHSTFLRTCLESEGVEPVNLDEFRILRGSTATGSQNVGRLTNLMHLNLDTSWHGRYRPANTEFDPPIPRAMRVVNRPSIPRSEEDLSEPEHIQVIANTAAFHFRFIEQGVSSLYTSLSQRVKRARVLKNILGIGGQEIAHFLDWTNFAANVVQGLPFRFDDSDASVTNQGTTFPDSEVTFQSFSFQTSPRFSSRGISIRKDLPLSSVIRPVNDRLCSAVATIESFTENGLFFGQSTTLLRTLMALAEEADAAVSS